MTEEQFYEKRLITVTFTVIAIFFMGVVGYRVIEGWPFLDAIYMTVITLATIGYGETRPLSNQGRVFTIFLILSGLGIMGYGLGISASFIVEGQFGRLVRQRRMEKRIKQLSEHYIICGGGETGRCVVSEFVKTKQPFVLIDLNKDNIIDIQQTYNDDFCYIVGDATKDAVLTAAGIECARGLISTLNSDKDNLFVVLTARSLNEELRIVSRVIEPASERKLITAGANNVVSPNIIGGLRMASLMIRPAVVSFLDLMIRQQNATLRIEEVELPPETDMDGKTIASSKIFTKTGLLIIAMKKGLGYVYNPPPETGLQTGDVLIVIGDVDQINSLKKLVKPSSLL
ncbi:MAG: potassium channel protein [Blastocatellia bacterium]|nr:potassium channel protein [Blastocatellia bacterium]